MARLAICLAATLWLLGGAAGAGANMPTPDGTQALDVRDFHDGDRGFGGPDFHGRDFHGRDFRFRHFGHDRFRERFFFGGDFFDPGFYPYAYGPPQVWYWCANPPGYYPYVPQCAVPWQPVAGQ